MISTEIRLQRKHVGRLVPSNPKVLIMAMVGVAIANEAVF